MSFELEKILGVYSSQVSERKKCCDKNPHLFTVQYRTEQWWGYELNDLEIIVNLESNHIRN